MQQFTLTFTPTANLELLIKLNPTLQFLQLQLCKQQVHSTMQTGFEPKTLLWGKKVFLLPNYIFSVICLPFLAFFTLRCINIVFLPQ